SCESTQNDPSNKPSTMLRPVRAMPKGGKNTNAMTGGSISSRCKWLVNANSVCVRMNIMVITATTIYRAGSQPRQYATNNIVITSASPSVTNGLLNGSFVMY